MSRAIWKGAISFGLVHVPVALHSAVQSHDVDFDWIDERTMDPVGYKRVNKRTGREVDRQHIVRGVQHKKGEYVVVSDAELKAANPKATRTIELQAFVEAAEISFMFLETPYYLAPIDRGEKVYALLREALRRSGRIGVATLVIHARQHLAALIATDDVMVLHLLRWANEIRPVDELDLPKAGAQAAGPKPAELKMAQKLIEESTVKWRPADYHDTYQDDLHALIERKVRTGKVQEVSEAEAPAQPSAEVVDLTELLRRSLERTGGGKAPKQAKAPTRVAKASATRAPRAATRPGGAKPSGRKAA